MNVERAEAARVDVIEIIGDELDQVRVIRPLEAR
jgi:hypothetical protein